MSESIEELKRKICKSCNINKGISDFYFKKDRNDYSATCKKCAISGIKIQKSSTHKICKHCSENKLFSEYQKTGGGKWLQPYCKSCDAIRKSNYNKINRERIIKNSKENYKNNKDIIALRDKAKRHKYRLENPIAPRIYNKMTEEDKKKRKSQSDRKYREANKEKVIQKKINYKLSGRANEVAKEWQRRKSNDIEFVTKKRLRGRIYVALKRGIKSESTEKLLGCSIDYFSAYFESKFTKEMSWSEYLKGKIHIDHVRPCKLFDLTIPSEQRACFHYTNLQPLWGLDNLRKGVQYKEIEA